MYKDLLEYIVKNLVENKDVVSVDEIQNEEKLVLKLHVATEDMGRIIGKEGRIIKAIRELIYSYAMKNHQRVTVDVEEIK